MKKLILIALVLFGINAKAQFVQPLDKVIKPTNQLNIAGLELHQAGKLKNTALFIGIGAGILATQTIKKDGTTNKPIMYLSIGAGVTAFILEITANNKISKAGGRLKKLDNIQLKP